jgi:hypothetical protein
MHLVHQRDEFVRSTTEVLSHIRAVRRRLLDKMAKPYGDGSTSSLVNASSDVLPFLDSFISQLGDTLDATGFGSNADVTPELPSVRIW